MDNTENKEVVEVAPTLPNVESGTVADVPNEKAVSKKKKETTAKPANKTGSKKKTDVAAKPASKEKKVAATPVAKSVPKKNETVAPPAHPFASNPATA